MVDNLIKLIFIYSIRYYQSYSFYKKDPTFSSEWDYQAKGPDSWKSEFQQCGGTRQSPIGINTKNLYTKNLGNIIFKNYDKELSWNFTNNGHTGIIYNFMKLEKAKYDLLRLIYNIYPSIN